MDHVTILRRPIFNINVKLLDDGHMMVLVTTSTTIHQLLIMVIMLCVRAINQTMSLVLHHHERVVEAIPELAMREVLPMIIIITLADNQDRGPVVIMSTQ